MRYRLGNGPRRVGAGTGGPLASTLIREPTGREPAAAAPATPATPGPRSARGTPRRGAGAAAVSRVARRSGRASRWPLWVSAFLHVGLPVGALLAPVVPAEPPPVLHVLAPLPVPEPEPEVEVVVPPPVPALPEDRPVLVEEDIDPDPPVAERAPDAPSGLGATASWRDVFPAVKVGGRVRGSGAAQAGTADAAPAPPPPPAPRAAGPTRRPVAIAAECAPPDYPEGARRRGVEGRVLLLVSVDSTGAVIAVEIGESSGSDLLDEAARAAVEGWRFEPALLDGEPVSDRVRVPVRFRIERSG